MKAIFLTGTAGAGKTLLASKINEYYTKNGAFSAILNLDPGVDTLPYSPDIDVRDFVDIQSIMNQYELGPNGSLIMASDLIASKIDVIGEQINAVNPDYLIIDTPGQIELFAYRQSGQFFIKNIEADDKVNLFLYDGPMVTTPINFVSIALLSTSIKLRLSLPTINLITKIDLIEEKLQNILEWSSNMELLEKALSEQTDGETYSLTTNILRSLGVVGLSEKIIPISNSTGVGMENLHSALSRIINMGEEIED